MGYNFVADNMGLSSFISCALLSSLASKSTKYSEILREFELIAGQGHRSWYQSKEHMWLPVSDHSNLAVSPIPFSRYRRLKIENGLFSPPLHCLTLPRSGGALEFRDETYPAKTIGMGLYGVNFIIITSTVLYDTSVWQTDGRAIACSRSRSSKHALCCQPVAC